jgi:hypothetical protein
VGASPFSPGLELHADAVIIDGQIAVASAMHGVGCDLLHLLRHHPDIGGVIAALIAEPVKLKPVSELLK